jgi:transposase
MLAEMVDHVVGVDPDRDWITAGVVDAATTGVVATARFAANAAG